MRMVSNLLFFFFGMFSMGAILILSLLFQGFINTPVDSGESFHYKTEYRINQECI